MSAQLEHQERLPFTVRKISRSDWGTPFPSNNTPVNPDTPTGTPTSVPEAKNNPQVHPVSSEDFGERELTIDYIAELMELSRANAQATLEDTVSSTPPVSHTRNASPVTEVRQAAPIAANPQPPSMESDSQELTEAVVKSLMKQARDRGNAGLGAILGVEIGQQRPNSSQPPQSQQAARLQAYRKNEEILQWGTTRDVADTPTVERDPQDSLTLYEKRLILAALMRREYLSIDGNGHTKAESFPLGELLRRAIQELNFIYRNLDDKREINDYNPKQLQEALRQAEKRLKYGLHVFDGISDRDREKRDRVEAEIRKHLGIINALR